MPRSGHIPAHRKASNWVLPGGTTRCQTLKSRRSSLEEGSDLDILQPVAASCSGNRQSIQINQPSIPEISNIPEEPIMTSIFKTLRLSIACLATIATATAAYSTPVAYQESTSGDLNGWGAMTIFTLDAGTNTVSGRIGTSSGGAFDFDSFSFIIPHGLALTSLQLVFNDASGEFIEGGWLLFSGSTEYKVGDYVDVLTATSPGKGSIIGNFGEGAYNLGSNGYSTRGLNGGTADYVISLTTTPTNSIPVPGTLTLLGAALLAFPVARRRKN